MTGTDSINEILNATRRIRANIEKYTSRAIGQYGLSYSQAMLLIMIAKHNGITVKELSKLANISLPNCSSICSRMEKAELIKREKNHNGDQRFLSLNLTDKARGIIEEVENEIINIHKKAVDKLDDSEREAVRRGLLILDKALEDEGN